jgi:hypothetical protein
MNRIALLAILYCLISCNTDCGLNKDQFVDNYITLVKETSNETKDLSPNDWRALDTRVNNMLDGCYKNVATKLTKQDKLAIWTSTAYYLYLRHGHNLLFKLNSNDVLMTQLKEGIQSVDLNFMDLIKKVKDFSNDPNKLDELLKDIN